MLSELPRRQITEETKKSTFTPDNDTTHADIPYEEINVQRAQSDPQNIAMQSGAAQHINERLTSIGSNSMQPHSNLMQPPTAPNNNGFVLWPIPGCFNDAINPRQAVQTMDWVIPSHNVTRLGLTLEKVPDRDRKRKKNDNVEEGETHMELEQEDHMLSIGSVFGLLRRPAASGLSEVPARDCRPGQTVSLAALGRRLERSGRSGFSALSAKLVAVGACAGVDCRGAKTRICRKSRRSDQRVAAAVLASGAAPWTAVAWRRSSSAAAFSKNVDDLTKKQSGGDSGVHRVTERSGNYLGLLCLWGENNETDYLVSINIKNAAFEKSRLLVVQLPANAVSDEGRSVYQRFLAPQLLRLRESNDEREAIAEVVFRQRWIQPCPAFRRAAEELVFIIVVDVVCFWTISGFY
nr:hypothetical protein Iba_chr09eCG3970 [Ipomoea batatas]